MCVSDRAITHNTMRVSDQDIIHNAMCVLDRAITHNAMCVSDRAVALGQDLSKIPFKDRSWLGYKTRSRESVLFIIAPLSNDS